MNGILVVDASVVLAALVVEDERADAAASRMRGASLVAPDLIGYEVMNSLRRRRGAGRLSDREARRAFDDWRRLGVEVWPLAAVADRVWEMTGSMTVYDAAYVALAELLDAPLLTADRRLARAPGLGAEVVLI